MWGQTLRPTDLTDDRLAEVVRVLSFNEVWHPLERRVNQQMIRAYALPVQQVRLDSTTASVYGGNELSVLFQRGHASRKDHRPDLRQFKAMLAALDPLGVLVGVDVVAGNQADDGLYVPMLARLRTTLPPQGLLYIGDCKMGALATRAYIQSTHNWYLMPLAQVGSVPEDLASWVAAAVKGKVKLTPIREADGKKHLGEAYELKRRLSAQTGTDTLKWVERVLIVRSDSYTQAAVRGLHQRLTHAERDLRALTPPRGRGQRQFTEEAPLQAAVQAIVQRYEVDGLLKVQLAPEVERQMVRAYAASPAHVVERTRYGVTVQKNQARIRTQEQLLGWRVYVTNAPLSRLSLTHAIQTYRDEWLVERDCARLKGRPLSLRPVWLSRDDHAVGLTRLLTLAARVLALAEYQVRRKLADEQRSLDHLYAGQPTRRTAAPTTERLLKAFDHIVLTLVQKGKRIQYHLTPLSDLQRTILRDLECPRQLYQQWIPKSWKPLKI